MKIPSVPSRLEPPIVRTPDDLRRYRECISTTRLESCDLIVRRVSWVGEHILLYSVEIGVTPILSSQIGTDYLHQLLANGVWHAVRGASKEF